MREPRVSQPEYNYIFSRLQSDDYSRHGYFTSPRTAHVLHELPEALKTRKIGLPLALASGWKFHCGRHGLSPFVLHWLTQSKEPVEEFYDRLLKTGYFTAFYCNTTRLPVIISAVRDSWNTPETYSLIKRDWVEPEETKSAKSSFKHVLPLYLKAKEDGSLNDEFMRNFYGSAISKAHWLYLKGIVGIYE